MRKVKITLLCALACLAVSGRASAQTQAPGDTVRLTLNDCIEIAMSDNLTVQIAGKEIEKQSYARKSTYSSLYPQIGIDGAYQRTIKKQKMFMDLNGQSTSVEVGRSNTWNTTLGAQMPLVNPQLWKTLEISDLDVDLAVEKSRGSKLDMINTVTECYYTVLLSAKTYEIMQKALENAQSNFENISHKFDLGLASEYDKIRASVEVASYEPNVFSALNAIELAKWKLKSVIGMNLDIPIFCVGDLEDYADMMHSTIDENIQLDNNTSIKQLNIQMEQMDKTVQLYKRAYLPTLALAFNYQIYAMDNTYDFGNYQWTPYSTASLALNIPVFSGMKRMNDIRKTKVQKSQLEITRENTRRELYVSAKQIISSMETYVKQYDAADKSVEQALRGYDISTKRYDTGKGTILEVNDSRLAATQAVLNRDQAIYNYLIAKATFEKIMGKAVE